MKEKIHKKRRYHAARLQQAQVWKVRYIFDIFLLYFVIMLQKWRLMSIHLDRPQPADHRGRVCPLTQ